MNAGLLHPQTDRQTVLRLFVAPVALEQVPSTAVANHVEDLRRVVGQVNLDSKVRFGDFGDVVGHLRARLLRLSPRDVFKGVPTAVRFRILEVLKIEVVEAVLERGHLRHGILRTVTRLRADTSLATVQLTS